MGKHQAIQHAAGPVDADHHEIGTELVQSVKDGRNHRSNRDLDRVIYGVAFGPEQIRQPLFDSTLDGGGQSGT
jgi:hypothetical protein